MNTVSINTVSKTPSNTATNNPLRFNEALLIVGSAFKPFDCIAWTQQEGKGELSLTIVDRTRQTLDRRQISSSVYSDPKQLASALETARQELCNEGHCLQPWSMQA